MKQENFILIPNPIVNLLKSLFFPSQMSASWGPVVCPPLILSNHIHSCIPDSGHSIMLNYSWSIVSPKKWVAWPLFVSFIVASTLMSRLPPAEQLSIKEPAVSSSNICARMQMLYSKTMHELSWKRKQFIRANKGVILLNGKLHNRGEYLQM